MKLIKIFSLALFGVMSLNAFAAKTAEAKIMVIAPQYEFSTSVVITEDDAVPANFSSSNNGILPAEPTVSDWYPQAWFENGTTKYSGVENKSISNLKFCFKANANETAYKITFSKVTGTIILQNDDTTYTVVEGDTLDVTCEKSATVEFTVNPAAPVYPRTVAAGQWATICYDKQITAVEGATMYELVKYDETKQEVAADPVDVDALVAGKAYLFMATDDAQAFTYTGEVVAEAQENNGLFGTFVEMQLEEDAWGIKKGTSLIYPAKAGSTVPAYCAYIDLNEIEDKTHAPARAGRKIFNVATTPTGMMLVGAEAAQDGKMMINGKLVIIKGGKMYNAQGAQL